MNIPTLEQFPLFEEDSYIFPTHKREVCQEGTNRPSADTQTQSTCWLQEEIYIAQSTSYRR